MDINKEDSELHGVFAALLSQSGSWNNLPTQNVGALNQCFDWFNKLGKRIDEALASEAEASVEATVDTEAIKEKIKKTNV